ncbi:hypothetical protein F5884DRAFT_243327 [Xylogone sp. PMI_703]|nr:hypothetical protein F5884DRAFT_243327 [Xylogone sp. PMI_703]
MPRTNMPKYTTPLQFQAITRCALCRKLLPKPNYKGDFTSPESVAWEYNILGICDIADSSEQRKIVVVRGDLIDAYTFDDDVPVEFKNTPSLTINICLGSWNQVEKVAYLIHVDCWKLVNVLNENLSPLSLYEFAQSTRPIFELDDKYATRDAEIDFAFITSTPVPNTELGRLLSSLSGLPAEIRLMISAYCTSSFLLSLMVIGTSSTVLIETCKNCLGRRTANLICPTAVNTLYAESISVFGHEVISCLRFNDARGIRLKRSGIKGLKFALGRYGLHALSVLYTDDTTSPWIGDPTNGWIGVMYGSDIGHLRILQDDLKYLRVDFIDEEVIPARSSQVLWDQDFPFAATESHHMLETVNIHQIRNYPDWKLCRYLPFLDGGEYISGLTMYSTRHSITGIMTHGKSDRLIGSRQGCPIHFHLNLNEHIQSVWLRMPIDHCNTERDPTILITTSLNRTCVFGPYLTSVIIRDCRYSWSCLHMDPRSEITGIFYDALSARSHGLKIIKNIGITENTKAGTIATPLHLPSIPMLQHMHPTTGAAGYLSIGNLYLVKRLEARKVGRRFTGMSIHHEDGSIEILGQWDPSQKSLISEIYNHNHGKLTTLVFRFSGDTNASYVDAIHVCLDTDPFIKPHVGQKLKFFPASRPDHTPIMWWFTRLYDHIEPWAGTYQKINVSTYKYNIVDLK